MRLLLTCIYIINCITICYNPIIVNLLSINTLKIYAIISFPIIFPNLIIKYNIILFIIF